MLSKYFRLGVMVVVVSLFCFGQVSATEPINEAPSVTTESVGDWSQVIDQMRGRLIARTGLNYEGATEVRIYAELENLDIYSSFGKSISFNRDSSLSWELTDVHGDSVPAWKGLVPWTYSYASTTEWISVRGDGRIRFPVCSCAFAYFEEQHALVLHQGLIDTSPWNLLRGGEKEYLLRATFKGLERSKVKADYIWSGPLVLPPVSIHNKPRVTYFPAQMGVPYIKSTP